jgi:hypothetical protein
MPRRSRWDAAGREKRMGLAKSTHVTCTFYSRGAIKAGMAPRIFLRNGFLSKWDKLTPGQFGCGAAEAGTCYDGIRQTGYRGGAGPMG